jgi:hypothetical protein
MQLPTGCGPFQGAALSPTCTFRPRRCSSDALGRDAHYLAPCRVGHAAQPPQARRVHLLNRLGVKVVLRKVVYTEGRKLLHQPVNLFRQ